MPPQRSFAAIVYALLAISPCTDAFAPSQSTLPPPPAASLPISTAPRTISTYIYSRSSTSLGPHLTYPISTSRLYAYKSTKKEGSNKKEDDSLSSSYDKALHKYRILFRCQLAILAYMAVGVVAFSWIFEKWPVVDSLYFSVVTFTTVG